MKGIWVIKIGGEIFDKEESSLKNFFSRLAGLAQHQDAVLVHGGGPQLTRALKNENMPAEFAPNGLRVTSLVEMKIVEKVLSGEINKFIVDRLSELGVKAKGFSGKEQKLIQAEPIPGMMGSTGRPLRRPVKGPAEFLQKCLGEGCFPVVSPVSIGPEGQSLNVNADDAATYIAQCLKADRLVFLTNVPGVCEKDRLIPDLTVHEALAKIGTVVKGGMTAKVNAAARAVREGVKEVWISPNDGDLIHLTGTRIHGE